MEISGQELWRRMGSPEVAEQDEATALEEWRALIDPRGGCICDSGMPHEIGCPER